MTESPSPEELERSDVSSRTVQIVGWGFGGFLVVMALFLWWRFGEKIESWRTDTATYSLERYPAPRLLPDPTAPLSEVHAREAEALTHYAWTDSSRRTAQVPLVRALEIAARNQLIRLRLKPPPAGSRPDRSEPGASHAR